MSQQNKKTPEDAAKTTVGAGGDNAETPKSESNKREKDNDNTNNNKIPNKPNMKIETDAKENDGNDNSGDENKSTKFSAVETASACVENDKDSIKNTLDGYDSQHMLFIKDFLNCMYIQ